MALLQFLLLVVILPSLIQAQTSRCGTDWTDASNRCGTPCPSNTDKECQPLTNPSGQHCFASLTTAPCSVPVTPVTPTAPKSSTTRTLTLQDLQSLMGRPSGTDLSGWLSAVNTVLQRYQLNTDKRIIAFLSQVRHETAGMTVFFQPADNGAGFVHMIPQNWLACCQNVPEIQTEFASWAKGRSSLPNGCASCSCVAGLSAADQTDAAKNIFGNVNKPLLAALSGAYWFEVGAKSVFSSKGCSNPLSYYADQGRGSIPGGAGDCNYLGDYQVTCCIFWTINENQGSGLTQRLAYYDAAVNYAKTAWGYSAAESEEITVFRSNPGVNAGIAIGCIVGIVAIVVVIVVVYLKRQQRLQSEVV